MENKSYYFCKICRTGVERSKPWCEKCRITRRLANTVYYTAEEIEQLKMGGNTTGLSDANIGEGDYECPSCGRRYGAEVTLCRICGDPLMPAFEKEQAQPPVSSKAQPEETAKASCQPSQNGSSELIIPAVESERIYAGSFSFPEDGRPASDIDFELEFSFFLDNRRINGLFPVPVNRTVMRIGRTFCVNSCIFSDDKNMIEESTNRVSHDAATVIYDNGHLYIQYDHPNDVNDATVRKSALYINGMLLDRKARREITDRDRIILGSNRCNNNCIEICVHKKDYGRRLLEDIRQGIDKVDSKMDSHHAETMAKLSIIENLTGRYFNNNEELVETVSSAAAEVQTKSDIPDRDALIDIMLKDYDSERIKNCLSEEALNEHLYQAALIEYYIKSKDEGQASYTAAFIFLGQLFEIFSKTKLRDVYESKVTEDWENHLRSRKGTKSVYNPPLVDYSAFMNDYYDHRAGKKVRKTQLRRKLSLACYNTEEQEKQLETLFTQYDSVRGMRNKYIHPEDKEELSQIHIRYMSANDYEVLKNLMFAPVKTSDGKECGCMFAEISEMGRK